MSLQPTLFSIELAQAGMARTLRSMLDLSRQANARQGAAALELLHNGLGVFHPGVILTTRELLEVQADLIGGLGVQWKNTFDHLAERGGTCIGDMRVAGDQEELLGALALFASDMSERLHADAERLGKLIASAGEAGKVLFARGLDNMIGDGDDDADADGDGDDDGQPASVQGDTAAPRAARR